jgi:putative endonuclease
MCRWQLLHGQYQQFGTTVATTPKWQGANYTKKHLPVKLVYFEEFQRIDDAFYREKQVQGWSRKKKEALINGCFDRLSNLSKNYTQYPRKESVSSTGSDTGKNTSSPSTSSGGATK